MTALTYASDVIDLDTPEGIIAHLKTLSDENLQAISVRPLDQFNIVFVVAAGLELDLREALRNG